MRRIRLFLVVLRRNGGLPLLSGLVVLTLAAALVVLALTGVIVTFYQERRDAQLKQSVAELLDKLERLPELDEEELRQISESVRRYRV